MFESSIDQPFTKIVTRPSLYIELILSDFRNWMIEMLGIRSEIWRCRIKKGV